MGYKIINHSIETKNSIKTKIIILKNEKDCNLKNDTVKDESLSFIKWNLMAIN